MTRKSSVMRRVTVALATTIAVSTIATFALWSPKQSEPSLSPVLRASDACYAAQEESPVQNTGLRVLATKVLAGRSITFRVTNPSVLHLTEQDWNAQLVKSAVPDENGNEKYDLVDSLSGGYWYAESGDIVANADGSFTYTAPIRTERSLNKIDYIVYQNAENAVVPISQIPIYVEDAPEDASASNESVGGEEYAIEGTTNASPFGSEYELPSVDGDAVGRVTASGQQGIPSVVSLRLTKAEWSEPTATEPTAEGDAPSYTSEGNTQSQRVQQQDPLVIDFTKECNTTGTWEEGGEWHDGESKSTGWKTISKWQYDITSEMSGRILKIYRIKINTGLTIQTDVKYMTIRYNRWRWKYKYKCVNGESVLVSKRKCTQNGVGALYMPSWIALPMGYPENGDPIWQRENCK